MQTPESKIQFLTKLWFTGERHPTQTTTARKDAQGQLIIMSTDNTANTNTATATKAEAIIGFNSPETL